MDRLGSTPKVVNLRFRASGGGEAEITVARMPSWTNDESPYLQDLPADLAQALRVWLAGNQAK